MPKPSTAPAIIDAARACLIEGGGNFEMKQVTDRIGVSEGLVYHYFKSKAGLMTAILEDYFSRYSAVVNRHVDRDVPWLEREEVRLKDAVAFLYSDPMTRIVLGGLNRLPEAAKVEEESRRRIAERSINNVRSGMDQGIIPKWVNADIAGPATIGAMDQAVMHALSQDNLPKQEDLGNELWRIIKAILGITQ